MVNKLEVFKVAIGIVLGAMLTAQSFNELIVNGMWLYLPGLIVGPALLYWSISMLLDLNVDIEGEE